MALVSISAVMAADTARASYAVSALKTAGNAVSALRIVAIRRSWWLTCI